MAGIERRGQQLGSVRVADDSAPVGADLSTLLRADLVGMAVEAGIDPKGLTKAELVEALQPQSEGDT